jgi:3-dehydroquinate synthase
LTNYQTITVDLGARSYPIFIGSGLLGEHDLASHLQGPDCLVVTNDTVGPLYLDRLLDSLGGSCNVVSLPDGEKYKTSDSSALVIDKLVACSANRDTTVVALGGGVVGDIAGFAAACYLRGVAFIQVPTTLLAQVDSSVGGKTGVNHPGGKNLIGAFHQPQIVLIDTDTLDTLAERELKAGLAEVIKYGAIADVNFLGWLEENMPALLQKDATALTYAIGRCCELKAQIVAEDERETGRRALLNFGHTFAHAIENSLGYGEWLHGEAVAAGMLMASAMSGLDPAALERLRVVLQDAGLPTAPPAINPEKLRAAMRLDKKVKSKKIRLVLLRELGDAYLTSDYDDDRLDAVLSGADG